MYYYNYTCLSIPKPPPFIGMDWGYLDVYIPVRIPDPRKCIDYHSLLTSGNKLPKIRLSNKAKAKLQRRLDYNSRSRRIKRKKELAIRFLNKAINTPPIDMNAEFPYTENLNAR